MRNVKTEFNNKALLVIDVQPTYCAPDGWHNQKAAETAKELASIVPEFRKAGVPVYVIYYDKKKRSIDNIDFYQFEPKDTDIPIAKNDDSAFRGSNIDKVLKSNGHTELWVTGFNHNVCVYKTVMDALKKKYEVKVLKDLTGNETINDPFGDEHESYSKIMEKAGATITNSQTVLKSLKR